jgi:hypothetical protein
MAALAPRLKEFAPRLLQHLAHVWSGMNQALPFKASILSPTHSQRHSFTPIALMFNLTLARPPQ